MVEIRILVLKLKLSLVTDVAERENVEPKADQVITMELELSLYIFVGCCSHLTDIQNSLLL
jgi:hypothetical protein